MNGLVRLFCLMAFELLLRGLRSGAFLQVGESVMSGRTEQDIYKSSGAGGQCEVLI